MNKLKMQSPDATVGNVAKIAALFPQCVTERIGKDGHPELAVDFDKLREELGADALEPSEERYQFTWPDKKASGRLANTPSTMTLRPCREESVNFDTTQNLYIEGDNLEVLKILREDYLGAVKMIYIDPPYNTGNDFVYNDDFAQGRDEYETESGAFDAEGNQMLDPMQRNTEANGRFHTDWLNMIYPRLKVARELLSDDGVIFISIGDDENANLIKIVKEIFGERNFIADICHKSRASVSNDRIISENHNHLLFCCKNIEIVFANHRFIGEDPLLTGFNLQDERGAYKLAPVDGPGGAKKGNPYYEFHGITGYWRYSKQTMQDKYNKGLIVVTGNNLQQKYYLDDAKKSRRTVTTWWDEGFLTSTATRELIELMGSKTFDNPKNVNLVLRCLKMITAFDKDAVILDFFSGSATTAHAVMKLNAEDGGHRKFIMVQLPEITEEQSEARKAGYTNICEIGKERIRRSGRKVKEEAGLHGQNLDIGFRVLKLDTSNMEDIYYTPDDLTELNLFSSVDNVKPDRTPLDLLFQVMPEFNIELSATIEEKSVNGKWAFLVNGNYLIATFDDEVNESTITEIAKLRPVYFVMRDSSAANDNVLDNFEQIFKHYSPETIRRIL
ncbi:MAG: site-specific DNA-methyltransferase [Candidatus Limisoma sp.]|nr:site-specific DNA-methyltransferase [Bacteroidales bacterium]MDY3858891.1 site-specific DNA-methyltransferase [Muribaculaceae bacterium]MDY5894594.1 site-specific DNA-methyltransferase [Candidatus Limisoma sp.]